MLHQLFRFLDRLGAILAKIFNLIGGIALVLLIPSFAWLVYGRYVLNSTPTWVEQVSLLLMVLITFPVAAAGVRENSHLSVSFVRDSFPPRIAACLAILSYAGMAVFGYFMMMGGIDLASFSWTKVIPIIHISDGWRSVPMAMCGGGMAFYSVLHILKILARWNVIARSSHYSDDLLDEEVK